MKVFNIQGGVCHHHHWEYASAEEVAKNFVPDWIFVEAPDWVHEGWGYDDTKEGDDRFICPPMEVVDNYGNTWLYDGGVGITGTTGQYYLKETPLPQPTENDLLKEEIERLRAELTELKSAK